MREKLTGEIANRRDDHRSIDARAGFGFMRLGQPHRGEDQIRKGQRRGEESWNAQIAASEQPANRGTDHEAEAEGRADHPHPARAIRLVGGVGDVGLRGGDRRGTSAMHRARQKKSGERSGESIDEVSDRRAQQSEHDDRAASDAIGNPSEDRREDKLRQRVDRHDRADAGERNPQPGREHRQQRNHDSEAEQIDEYGDEQNQPRRRGRLRRARLLLGCFQTWH